MLKKIIATLLAFILTVYPGIHSFAEPLMEPELSNTIFLLGTLDHMQVLHSLNADEIVYPASTTKMLTALVVLDSVHDLDQEIIVDSDSPYLDGSIIALNEGEIISYRDLLSGMLIASGNDAASALAIAVAGSIDAFANKMNEKAKEIGCTQSHFANPHGLHDDTHYTTARDLYLIALECMKNQVFRDIVSKSTYEIQPTNKQPEVRYLRTTNSLFYGADHSDTLIEVNGETVQTYYPNAIGIKTGYTEEAMRCLVSAAADGEKGVIAIVMHSDNDSLYQDIVRLLEYGLHGFDFVTAKRKDEVITEIQLNDPSHSLVGLATGTDLQIALPTGSGLEEIEYDVVTLPNIAPPVNKEQVLGSITAKFRGKEIGTVELVSIVDFAGDKLLNDEIVTYGNDWKVDWKELGKNALIFAIIWILLYILLKKINKKRRQKRPLE